MDDMEFHSTHIMHMFERIYEMLTDLLYIISILLFVNQNHIAHLPKVCRIPLFDGFRILRHIMSTWHNVGSSKFLNFNIIKLIIYSLVWQCWEVTGYLP